MIPASSYDFVNVPAGFIKGAGAGFVSRSPLPTLEDAAYMREIYRTVKCREGYAMSSWGDSWTVGAGQKDDIPMMPRQERWEGDLSEIAQIIGANGYTFQSLRPARFDHYELFTSQAPEIYMNGFDTAKFYSRLVAASGPSVAPLNSRIAAHDDVKSAYTTVINALRTWRSEWPWYYRMATSGRRRITEHSGGLDAYFVERECEWHKNGSTTTETPRSFISDFSSSYRPSYYTQRSNDGHTTTYSLEGRWGYQVAAPPFVHGRVTTDGALYATPIWCILITRLWNVKNLGTETVYKGVMDRKIWEIYWHGSPLDIVIPRTYGHLVEISVLVNETGGVSTAANGNLILSNSGAVNFARPTSPSGSLPTHHEEEVDGYDADIFLAGVVFTNFRGTRNLNV